VLRRVLNFIFQDDKERVVIGMHFPFSERCRLVVLRSLACVFLCTGLFYFADGLLHIWREASSLFQSALAMIQGGIFILGGISLIILRRWARPLGILLTCYIFYRLIDPLMLYADRLQRGAIFDLGIEVIVAVFVVGGIMFLCLGLWILAIPSPTRPLFKL
jgi:hypothetical protein